MDLSLFGPGDLGGDHEGVAGPAGDDLPIIFSFWPR